MANHGFHGYDKQADVSETCYFRVYKSCFKICRQCIFILDKKCVKTIKQSLRKNIAIKQSIKVLTRSKSLKLVLVRDF